MKPVIYFRKDFDSEDELNIASQYFDIVEYRAACPPGSLVIPRYSALPYCKELERDLVHIGCEMINSYAQHRWIANFEYYESLKAYTPESWDDYTFQDAPEGEFVVKGRTNSRKFDWDTMMYASTRRRATEISGELMKDGLIGPQGVIYRRYVPLRTYEIGLNGLPFTNEWRFFFYKETMLSYGYYWSSADDEAISKAALSIPAIDKAKEIAAIVSTHVPFFVLDMGETVEGDWILIEVNDGQMSGLSENDPHVLYSKLREVLE